MTKSDLRLNEEQSRRFYKECLNSPLSDKEFTVLHSWTQGWEDGMQLVASIFREYSSVSDFTNHFSGEHRYLNEYFDEQVFSLQPAKIRDFLVNTAIPDQFNATLFETVTGETKKQGLGLLDEVIRRDLFLVPCTENPEMYCYEPLFLAFLRYQLQKMADEERKRLYERTATWCVRYEYYHEAIDFSIQAGSPSDAASVMVRFAPALLKDDKWDKTNRWLELMRKLTGRQKAEVGLLIGWVQLLKGEFGSLKEVLAQTGKAIHESGLRDGFAGERALLNAFMAFALKDSRGAMTKSDEAFSLLTAGGVYWDSQIKLNAGEAELIKGKMGLNGRLTMTHEFYHHLARYRSQIPDSLIGYGSVVYAELMYEWNKPGIAQHLVEKALSMARKKNNIPLLVPAVILQTRLLQIESGDTSTLQSSMIEKVKAMAQNESPIWGRLLTAQQIRLLLLQGKGKEADLLMRKTVLEGESGIDSLHEFEILTDVHLLMANKQYDRAQAVLESFQFTAENEDRYGRRIEIFILQAIVYAKTQRIQMAATVLMRGLALAEREGYLRSFLDHGEMIYRVLRYIDQLELYSSAYLHTLLAWFESERNATSVEGMLTQREQDVLVMIAEGLTNRDMADDMQVTLGTVKGYVGQLYRKFDVHSRTQAISRGREWGVLE